MGKLIVGMPLYHHVPAPFFTRWLSLDRSSVACAMTVNGAYITTACEVIAKEALRLGGVDAPWLGQGPVHHVQAPLTLSPKDFPTLVDDPVRPDVEWDRLVILEHDVLIPTDAFERIARYEPHHDVVGAMVFEHAPPHPVMAFVDYPDGHYEPITPSTVKTWCDVPQLYQCDATSFSLISIARHVLEEWDHSVPMFGLNREVGSHDLWFARKARAQGFTCFVDSGIVCEHLTSVPIGYTHNQSIGLAEGAETREFAYSGPGGGAEIKGVTDGR
jgi:hypothetical protein